MYADDTSIYTSNSDIKRLIQLGNKELTNIVNWLNSNKLAINISKTKYIIFQTPRKTLHIKPSSLTIRGIALEKVSTIKFLGIYVDQNLSWNDHINYLLTKLRCGYGVVCKIKPLLNKAALLHLYNSLINSHLQYCITNWCFGSKTLCNKLQLISNKFLKMVFGVKVDLDLYHHMVKHNILT